jgi:3-phosphoshikimate 1-carboxyvinyltransferase
VQIKPARHFRGRFQAPGDKSLSHRLAILGALAEGQTRLSNYGPGEDVAATLACLVQLGVGIDRVDDRVVIEGRGIDALHAPGADLDVGNSGSTMRIMLGVLAGRPFGATLKGDASLSRRPMERVAEPLRAMGAQVVTTGGCPPVRIRGGGLSPVDWRLSVASAQLKTAILLAGMQTPGTTRVTEPAASRDHTERLLPLFGVPVTRAGLSCSVSGGARLRAVEMAIPGDPSTAAFLVLAALICPDSSVEIDNVLLNPTRIGFFHALRDMGADLEWETQSLDPEPVGCVRAATSRLHGITVEPERVPALIDEAPALAVAAAVAEGRTLLSGAAELRVKESDRIAALAAGLGAMGVAFEERPDGFVIEGGRSLHGARVRADHDHRIAMALSVAALVAEGATDLEGAECVAVSFPRFFDHLRNATSA